MGAFARVEAESPKGTAVTHVSDGGAEPINKEWWEGREFWLPVTVELGVEDERETCHRWLHLQPEQLKDGVASCWDWDEEIDREGAAHFGTHEVWDAALDI